MFENSGRNVATLHARLSEALALADDLDLTIVAIHIDEALALIGAPAGCAYDHRHGQSPPPQ